MNDCKFIIYRTIPKKLEKVKIGEKHLPVLFWCEWWSSNPHTALRWTVHGLSNLPYQITDGGTPNLYLRWSGQSRCSGNENQSTIYAGSD